MKKISVKIGCYNEVENIREITAAVIEQIKNYNSEFDYEIVIIDNCSTDGTKEYLHDMAKQNKKIKVIFNARNFYGNSGYYGLLQTTGDCTINMAADFQDPPDLIPTYLQEWEKGNKIICGVKKTSKESKLMYFIRSCYYKLIKKMSRVEQIEHMTGFGLFDKEFLDIIKTIDDPLPYFRGMITELGYKMKLIEYTQPPRRAGKTKNNFFTLVNTAMTGITAYTRAGLRGCLFFGSFLSAIAFIAALILIIVKITHWNTFFCSIYLLFDIIIFLCSICLVFIGVLGEFVYSINIRTQHRPLVIEEERINF